MEVLKMKGRQWMTKKSMENCRCATEGHAKPSLTCVFSAKNGRRRLHFLIYIYFCVFLVGGVKHMIPIFFKKNSGGVKTFFKSGVGQNFF